MSCKCAFVSEKDPFSVSIHSYIFLGDASVGGGHDNSLNTWVNVGGPILLDCLLF